MIRQTIKGNTYCPVGLSPISLKSMQITWISYNRQEFIELGMKAHFKLVFAFFNNTGIESLLN